MTRERQRNAGEQVHRANGPPVAPAGGIYEAWVARYNGPGYYIDEAHAIAVDGSGNVYITGRSSGAGTGSDYATIKYNSAGQQRWVARYNGPVNGDDETYAIAIDSSGNVYVTGRSAGAGTADDYLTIKYNSAGQEQWVARYNGPATENYTDQAYAIAVDGSGNIYVTGTSFGANEYDYATIKYNADGQEQWVARYNGPGNGGEDAYAIAIDSSGNVYVTGTSIGSGTEADYATIKYDSAGQQQWVARYNGPGNFFDIAYAIAVDESGNVYVTGESLGSGTNRDYATIKYNSAGQEQWVARYNGPGNGRDEAYAIAMDGSGNVYVTGESFAAGAEYDYAIIKYDSAGQEQWVARYNGPGNFFDIAYAIAVDESGNVYVTGESTGSGTSYDYATIKYVQGPPNSPTPTPTPSPTPTPMPTPTPSISINPSKDNTLYEYVAADGDRSNGVGDYFFTGKTAVGLIRRGALAFDIAGNIPPGSTITSASLSMHMSRTSLDTNRTVELHVLLDDWGEGTSDASGEEGDGAPATASDVTWRHRFFDTIFWATQGGDFSNTVSASQSVGGIGDYTWSSAQMVADVQSWLGNPVNNFGWLVLGDESDIETAKRFDTRESTSPPVLTIEYTTPTPTPTPTPSEPPHPTPTQTPTPTPTPTPTVPPTPTPTPSSPPRSPTPTPTVTPTPGQITLAASGRRVQGRHTVDLTWSGATSANIDIYRDGVVITTVPNNGSYKDFIGVHGGNVRYTYKVCEAATQNCSNQVTVRFGGPPL